MFKHPLSSFIEAKKRRLYSREIAKEPVSAVVDEITYYGFASPVQTYSQISGPTSSGFFFKRGYAAFSK